MLPRRKFAVLTQPEQQQQKSINQLKNRKIKKPFSCTYKFCSKVLQFLAGKFIYLLRALQ